MCSGALPGAFEPDKISAPAFSIAFSLCAGLDHRGIRSISIALMDSTQNCNTKVVELGILFSQHSMFLINPFNSCIVHPLGDAAIVGFTFKSIME